MYLLSFFVGTTFYVTSVNFYRPISFLLPIKSRSYSCRSNNLKYKIGPFCHIIKLIYLKVNNEFKAKHKNMKDDLK
jgi:hypothetical protein